MPKFKWNSVKYKDLSSNYLLIVILKAIEKTYIKSYSLTIRTQEYDKAVNWLIVKLEIKADRYNKREFNCILWILSKWLHFRIIMTKSHIFSEM